jgi:hypothetical protein
MEKIILAAVFGTSIMTLFSYVLSEVYRKLFKEPVLLTAVLSGIHFKASNDKKHVVAWLIHYGIGLVFTAVYDYLIRNDLLKVTLIDTFVFGTVIGIIGIVGWQLLFKISTYSPKSSAAAVSYYSQLFMGHLLFAFSLFSVYYMYVTWTDIIFNV